jgi:hypothetical protein
LAKDQDRPLPNAYDDPTPVHDEHGERNDPIWRPTHVAWNKEQLTRLVEKNLPNKFDADKDESGDISWVQHVMTPLL